MLYGPVRDRSDLLTLLHLPSKDTFKVPISEVLTAPPGFWDPHTQANEHGEEIYFGTALRCPSMLEDNPYKRGGKKDCTVVTAIPLDVDIKDDVAHNAKVEKGVRYPVSLEEVEQILEPFPEVSIGIHSGYGLHAYWLFDDPIVGDLGNFERQLEEFQRRIIEHAREIGLHVDKTDTVERIWRVPGFINHKRPDQSPRVHVLFS